MTVKNIRSINNYCSPSMEKSTVKKLKPCSIFGPFKILASLTGIFIPCEEKWPRWKKFLTYIPVIVIGLLFGARVIYLIPMNRKAEVLTKFWCYVTPCFFLSVFGLISNFTLLRLRRKNFFQKFLEDLNQVSQNSVIHVSIKFLILCCIFMFLYIFTAVLLCLENLLVYSPHNLKVVQASQNFTVAQKLLANLQPTEPMPTTLNDTIVAYQEHLGLYRNIMFGSQAVFPLDIIIIILGAYITSVTMAIYLLSIQSLTNNYEKFNKEIKNFIKEEKLSDNKVLIEIENRIIDYQNIADQVYSLFGSYISFGVMLGVIVHSAAQFAMRAYSENMYLPQLVVFGGWTVLGLVLIVLSLNRPTAFYKKTIETKDILWQEKGLFASDEQTLATLERIKCRIEEPIYAKNVMTSIKMSFYTIKAVLFIIMFGIDILAAFWKKNYL